ncbi:hypothetical protein [Paracoccus sp. (in: a-proteobacteria)]|uniref:hypothetical protein n=1 Tax=Paracoccus sp. TaxID=267 RepID=UPI00289DAECC|nr:hypothetical protein [Paracoccus sp. (in: a-proteobacteria)]
MHSDIEAAFADEKMDKSIGAEFLTGTGLAKRIRKIMAGDNPWMCVAFLGPTWTKELFDGGGPPKDLRVVCDVCMGMTVQEALRIGGAPNNEHLRHLPDQQMHAKVYGSDKGAVVCSANASRAALSSADRVEDGVWLPPGGNTYRKAKASFERRFGEAVRVDPDALARAPERLGGLGIAVVGESEAAVLRNPPTLLQLLRHDPEMFKGVRFVFSNEKVTQAVEQGAKAVMEEMVTRDGGAEKEGRAGPLNYDYFSNWEMREADWPALFISVHREANGSVKLGMRRHLRFISEVPNGEDEAEDVFVAAKVRWNTGGAAFGDLRKIARVTQCEIEIKDVFQSGCSFDDVAGQVLTAEGVRRALKLT